MPGAQAYKYSYRPTIDASALQQQYPAADFARYQNSRNVLEKVILPDTTAGTDTDNPTILHHYENTADLSLLTGVTDERGIRYATWAYQADKRAISSQLAGSNELFTLNFDDTNSKVTVTNPLGKQAIYNFSTQRFADRRLTSIEGQASANCPAANQSYTYDANSFTASVSDGEGRVVSYVNDDRGRATSITRGFGTAQAVTTTMAWHPTFGVPTQLIQPGLTTGYLYNAAGQLTSLIQTDTTTLTVPYSTAGQTRSWTYGYTGLLLTSVNGPLAGTGDTVSYAYNAQGFLTSVTNEVGHVTTVNTVNGRGQPTKVTDPNGLVTDFAYNTRGALTSITVNPGPSQRLTSMLRDAIDNITSLITADGVVINFTYDGARRLTKIQNAANESLEYSYNVMGNVIATQAKSGTTIVAERNEVFDELGRVLKSIGAGGEPAGRVWRYGYDKTGNITSLTDPRAQIFGSGFDSLNRLVSSSDPTGTVNLARDGKDAITGYTDPRSFTTSYIRNGFGEVIRRTSSDTGTTDYTYDARGLITRVLDARGFETLFTHDAAGRRLTKTHTGVAAENVTYTYDSLANGNLGKGRLTRMVDQAGNSDFTYDLYGNVTTEKRSIGALSYTVSYGYDAANRLNAITYPSGRSVTYARDTTGRMFSVTTKETSVSAAANLATGITWQSFGGSGAGANLSGSGSPMAAPMLPSSDVAGSGGGSSSSPGPVSFGVDASLIGTSGLVKSLNHSNGLGLWRTYDNDNMLGQLGVYDLAVQPPAARSLRFHSLTNNVSLTNIWDNLVPAENQSFWLNPAGRIQNADGPWGQDVYFHDGVGNRTQVARTVAGVTTTRLFGYPANSNRLALTSIGGVTERSFTHDAGGNMTGDNRGAAGNFTTTINRAGRIAASAKGGVAQGAYSYDAFERLRVRTLTNQTPATNNGTTHYVWDIFGNIIAEMNGVSGATLRETIYMGDMPLAAIDAVASPKKTYAIHVDHLNRPILMTDAAKATVWSASYEPFGKVRAVTGTATQNLGLPGQWFQLETGLAYNWHRHYDPTTGRYTTPDPLGFVDGPSVFAYAGSNPLVGVDRSGLFLPAIIGAGTAAAYFFTPSIANAPGPQDQIYQNNDIQPFENAGTVASTGALICTARTVLNPWSLIYAPGSWLNSGQYFRIGRGRAPYNRTQFRASGDLIEKITKKPHVDFKDLGPWSR